MRKLTQHIQDSRGWLSLAKMKTFSGQFETRMHLLKLGDCLEDKLKVTALKTRQTATATTARDQAEEEAEVHGLV